MGMKSREIRGNYEYFSSVFDKEMTDIFDRFYNPREDNSDIFSGEFYMDNVLDRVNVRALRK